MPLSDLKYCRPLHILDLIQQYDSGGIWDGDTFSGGTVSTTAAKNAVQAVLDDMNTDQDAKIVTADDNVEAILDQLKIDLKAGWPFADQPAYELYVDNTLSAQYTPISNEITSITLDYATYKTETDTAIDSNISGGTVVIKAVLEESYDKYKTYIDGELDYICPECSETGLAPVYGADGVLVPGETKISTLCDGFGKTEIQYIPTVPGFIPAP